MSHLSPLVSILFMSLENYFVLFGCPWLFVNFRIQVIVPPLIKLSSTFLYIASLIVDRVHIYQPYLDRLGPTFLYHAFLPKS